MSRFLGSNMRNKNKTSCYANYVKFVTNDIVPLNYDIIIMTLLYQEIKKIHKISQKYSL